MSVWSEIQRLTSLRDRISRKLVSLGLLSSNSDLYDCTEAVEDIDEVTPYLISTSGVKNVAGYKYAQIDESAWVPAGSTPSGLESHLTGLGATGILSSRPRNPISIGTVYPNTGSSGMYANALEIDGDVIKAENIKNGVQILGVTGSYSGSFNRAAAQSGDTANGYPVVFDISAPITKLKTLYIQSNSNSPNPVASWQIRSLYVALIYIADGAFAVAFTRANGTSATDTCAFTVTQIDSSTWRLSISVPPSQANFIGVYNLWYTYME